MKFTETFRSHLLESLQKNIKLLLNDSLALVDAAKDSCFRVVAAQAKYIRSPFQLDFDYAKKAISESDSNPLRLQLRDPYTWGTFEHNEIQFKIKLERPETPTGLHYRSERNNLEFDIEAEFWQVPDSVAKYGSISNLNLFIDTDILATEHNKYLEKGDIVNSDGWLEYVLQLISITFPEYILDTKNSAKRLRFLKPLTQSISWGFEFDKSEILRFARNGEIELPDYFNIILVNTDFKKSVKPIDYLYKYNENILSLGILGNPFFFQPCYPLSRFIAVDRTYLKGQPLSYHIRYFREFKKIDDDIIKIVHSQVFEEHIKKHAFFYMTCLSYTSKIYLKYLESSIIATINELKD